MAELEPIVPVGRTTTTLLRALGVTLVVVLVAVTTLTYAYLRVAHQLDTSRHRADCAQQTIASLSAAVSTLAGQANDNAVVLGRINDLASAFAELGSPDAAVRERARQRLAALAGQPPLASSAPRPATASTTSSTRPVAATTSTTHHHFLPTLPTVPKLPLQLAAADPCVASSNH